ncbi:MAG: ATP-grasp domain-containing protein, partial [Bacteroidetes bacterium]|nr:ATP-grasp domain-containing protein [Bacteroidota bacterium]
SDEYIEGDFSNSKLMLEIAKKTKCNFILSGANDFAYLSACEVADKLKLPGFDNPTTAYTLHHKNLFKEIAKSIKLPVTKFIITDVKKNNSQDLEDLVFPLIVKPVDLTGGKGISLVQTKKELNNAFLLSNKYSRSDKVIIEEFFYGSLHSYSTIIENEKIIFEYSDNEFCNSTPFLVTTSTSIVMVPHHILHDIKIQTEKLAKKLKLINGVLHCQFLYHKNRYVILEYTRRCSGDLYSNVVELVTGKVHIEQFVRQSMGLKTELRSSEITQSDYVSRHCIFTKKTGILNNIIISKNIKNNIYSKTNIYNDNYFYSSTENKKITVVIMKFDSYEAMNTANLNINNYLKYL